MRKKNCKNIKNVELSVANPASEFISILSKEKKVRVVGLGLFKIKIRKARDHYDGFTGKYKKLPARTAVLFKADEQLIKQL